MPERLMARFRPQAWINDYAVDVDGKVEFDATDMFLRLPVARVRAFRENNYDSDALADDLPVRRAHKGPFEVDVDIDDWLEALGYPPHAELTQDRLDALRSLFGVTGGE